MNPREPLHTYQESCDVREGRSCSHEDGHGPVAPVTHMVVEVPGGERGAEVRPPPGHSPVKKLGSSWFSRSYSWGATSKPFPYHMAIRAFPYRQL